MMGAGNPVRDALDRIEALRLPHPTGPLLSAFVTEALDPLAAADYLQKRLDTTDVDTIVSDWTFIVESVTKTSIHPKSPDTTSQQHIRERDADKCCITGRQGSRFDPLITTAVLPIPRDWATSTSPNIANMLGAFFGPAYRNWWLSYIQNPASISALQSHWLFKVSAGHASNLGHGVNDRLASLRDHSHSGHQVVDARFNGTHARLSQSMKCISLAQEFTAQHTTSRPKSWPIPWLLACQRVTTLAFSLPFKFLSSVFWRVWRVTPQRLRLSTYCRLNQLQTTFFGQANYGRSVVRLPFGLFLKKYSSPDICRNEFATLQMLRKHSSIPTPEPLDLIIVEAKDTESPKPMPGTTEATTPSNSDGFLTPYQRPVSQQLGSPELGSPELGSPKLGPPELELPLEEIPPFDPSLAPIEPEVYDQDSGQMYIVMSGLPGSRLGDSIDSISDPDLAYMCEELKGYLHQLRSIKNTTNTELPICSSLGEGIMDHRLSGPTPLGPLKDEAGFNQLLTYPDDPAFQRHEIVYTHGDLNARNILVDRIRHADGSIRWGITGIVDWETAGFFPEYWEYTKSQYESWRWGNRFSNFVENGIGSLGNYTAELNAEKRNWERHVAAF